MMITFQQAIELLSNSAQLKGTEEISIKDGLGRILAEDIFSETDLPPFDKSAMDGYACRKDDLRLPLNVIDVISAGKPSNKKIEKGQCAKIMTGAQVPSGADYVLIKERAIAIDETTIKAREIGTAANICYLGEDVRQGDLLLKIGTKLQPNNMALTVLSGKEKVKVYKTPTVGIFCTGNELKEPGEPMQKGEIRNTNATTLLAQCERENFKADYLGVIPDDILHTRKYISEKKEEYDIILITGGVSMGDFDYIPHVINDLKMKTIFHNIAIKPGKPTLFARHNSGYLFGIPGNPVSVFVIFEFLIKPFIYQLMSYQFERLVIQKKITHAIRRKNAERLAFIPVQSISENNITPVSYHGSGHLAALSKTDGFITMEQGKCLIQENENIDVRQI